ncbi:MAG: pyridoxal phosphate-dependent aminotransferase [candidate division KSB1 bacterium]|nr:pyridoxal phosphate-dependent aminotransferase [candidate division KSB1 bacterium]
MRFAKRMSRLGTETAFEMLARAKALEEKGREVIHLEIGEPDFDTPPHIVEAAVRALRQGYTHYSPAPGLPVLRQTIAEVAGLRRGIQVAMENVVVTPGAKPIMFFGILACVEEGDEVIYPDPGFPIYESLINFVGAKPVPIRLREERGFSFDVGELADLITERTKMIILNSPHNPTGGVLSRSDLEAIAELVRDRDIWILSDEIYKDIVYDGEFFSIASLPGMQEKTIILDGFSKTYAMTGWRLGYGIMPVPLAEKVTKLLVNSHSCTATFIQMAGVEALRGPQDDVYRMVAEFQRRRDVIVEGLNRIEGIRCLLPQGAFYVFPNVSAIPMSTRELEQYLLQEAGVATLSGTAFGKNGEGYLRFSYANSVENIQKALDRLEKALAKLR